MAKALQEARRVDVREFDTYPPEFGRLQRLLASFDVVLLDLDSDPDLALELVGRANAKSVGTILVYSEKDDPKLAALSMRAGARDYLLLPLRQGAMAEALARATAGPRKKAIRTEKNVGKLLVFAGAKGGSGVTTVACNVAIALAQDSDQRVLLIDLALPIGDAALCMGISARYSSEDAFRVMDRLDATLFENLLDKHRSGVFVLAAPTKVPEVEVSKDAIEKLIAIARRQFDHVIVDVGSRIDVAAKALFEDAYGIYLVIQTGISELRNANRLISQFFPEEHRNLQITINRFDSRFHETANDDVIAKALDRPVRWKIPNDQSAARALQSGDTGLAETRIARISLEMACSITGRPVPQEGKGYWGLSGQDRNTAQADSGYQEPQGIANSSSAGARPAAIVTWMAPGPITYGDKLNSTQFNATASVEGTFAYTPGPGYVLPAGKHTLWVTFTPADSRDCPPQQTATSIIVAKATPAIFWPTPAGIIHGAALGDAQLNAETSVDGRFDYSPAPGEILAPGSHTLAVIFTPADDANYTAARADVPLMVAKAAAKLEWPTPGPIPYGTQLSATQLCAVASVAGTYEYTPGFGALLAAGEHKLAVAFTPEDALGYSRSQSVVALAVRKATPEITWPAPEPIVHGAALRATQLNATATVPGLFVYMPAAGERLAPGVHKLSVTFTPTDTLNYTKVRSEAPLTVTEKSSAFITWPAPSAIAYGTELSDLQLNATASVPGTLVYTPSAGHILAPGRYTLSVSFTPEDNEQYATAHAAVLLEVKESPDIASLAAEAAETPFEWTFNKANLGDLAAEITDDRNATNANTRETRMYKGAVYEKGDDGQWHLQKN